jgi:transposase
MNGELTVTTEQVDDIPVLIASSQRMGVAELLDKHFEVHGNWQGISFGEMMEGWLTHILSEADHRLNQVEEWAAKRLETLRGCLNPKLCALDFSDDRLAAGLDLLSDDERWASFERDLNGRTIRVYNLKPKQIRIDTTTASGYWRVMEDGLFQRGHSKDHRPDLPQLKVALATMDPLGMPIVAQPVAGDRADDRLYVPVIDRVREGVRVRGLLYIGDCKMMSMETRVHLEAGCDNYLGPFSATQIPQERLDGYLEAVWTGEQPLTSVERCDANGKTATIAEGFEVRETLTAIHEGKEITWEERRLVIRSLAHAKTAKMALYARLQQAQTAIEALTQRKQGKETFTTVEELRQAAEKLVNHYGVEGLLRIQISEKLQEKPVRKYKERPAEIRVQQQLTITVQKEEIALHETIRRLGWRVYGTNCPAEELTLEQAVLAYREEYLVEHCFGRLKGKPLSLSPMYLEDDRRATGLTRLLSIGLRVLTLLEHVARSHLAENKEKLSGLYAGNPTRATDRPTTEAMLRAFKNVFLNFVMIAGRTYCHLSPLSDLQQKILTLLDLPADIYSKLADSVNPPEI